MNSNHLIVIDDEAGVCEYIAEVASEIGYTVATAVCFAEFEAAYMSQTPDVVVIDLCMPGMDGIEYLAWLADHDCRARILPLSGRDGRLLQAAGRFGVERQLDIAGILPKPLPVTELQRVFRSLYRSEFRVTPGDLRHALEHKEFYVEYQPKMRLSPARGLDAIDGFEALVRWRHPGAGLVSPASFIPQIENDRDQIWALTRLVLLASGEALRNWQSLGLCHAVSVNLSASLLDDPDLPERLDEVVESTGCSREHIKLEITETAAMTDPVQCIRTLSRLRIKGFGLSMDDFGTGYASLRELYRMPFSELKLDRSFVSEITSSEEAATIVRTTLDLARNLNLEACAEGVEDETTAALLRDWGCSLAQGYYYARPLGTDAATAFARDHHN